MRIGDLVSQLNILVILFVLLFAVYYVVRSILKQFRNSNSKDIEHKLDKIIELLNKEKKE
ncbi:DUF4083 family protein [Solibacillus daqui]|uniref:DUF4083 family protein n=1 Tax=Solibacillus daqui TaxID=2912187 RepID=UPI002366E151|nr:DUF4083 family protein [Solibacillus daqui]